MDIIRILREQIAALEQRLIQRIANQIQVTTVSRVSAKGEEDGATGWPDAGENYQHSPRRIQHFGFRSLPPKNTAAVMLLVGGGSASTVLVGEHDPGYGPDDLADGEVAIYSKATGAMVKITADGAAQVTAALGQPVNITAGTGANVTVDAGAGGSVVLQGGVLPVARQTDTAGPYAILGGSQFVKA